MSKADVTVSKVKYLPPGASSGRGFPLAHMGHRDMIFDSLQLPTEKLTPLSVSYSLFHPRIRIAVACAFC